MASVWASQESCPDCEVVWCIVVHVPYPEKFEATPVRPEDVITSLVEEGALYDLYPSIQC